MSMPLLLKSRHANMNVLIMTWNKNIKNKSKCAYMFYYFAATVGEHSVTDASCFIYTNKTGDCLFVCLFVCLLVCLSICSLMDGQTARPNGLKFGG